MPRKEPFGCERLVIVAGSVEHHFNDALDIAVDGSECTNIHAEAAGNRGSDLFSVKLFPLDLTALEHISSQRFQDGLLAEVESEDFHMTDQPALAVADARQRLGEVMPIPDELGPVLKLVDVHSPHLLRRMLRGIAAGSKHFPHNLRRIELLIAADLWQLRRGFIRRGYLVWPQVLAARQPGARWPYSSENRYNSYPTSGGNI
jgi:hypothetical protein